jgi:uncharacterized circularly permuted ATP-grasp superfamily protein
MAEDRGGRIENEILGVDFIGQGVAVLSQLPIAAAHRIAEKREYLRVVLEEVNLQMMGGAKTQKPVADGCGQGADTSSGVKQPKPCWLVEREHARHKLANFRRGKELAFLLAVIKRGLPFILCL